MRYGIAFRLKMLDNRIRRAMDARTRIHESGLTPQQTLVIRYLSEHSDRDVFQRDFETEFRITRATISNTLSLMEKRGLIRRESVAQDARLKKLTLTEQGRAVHTRAVAAINEINDCLEGALTPEEKEALLRSLDKMENALNQRTEDGV